MKISPYPSRVVITGVGLLTAIGRNQNEVWEAIVQGRSGIRWFRENGFEWPAGIVTEDRRDHLTREWAFQVSSQALQDAQVNLETMDPTRVGLTVSTSKGDVCRWLEGKDGFSLHQVNAFLISMLQTQGPALNLVGACATGLHSVEWGARWIREGRADLVLAGASDSVLHPFLLQGYQRSGMMAKFSSTNEPSQLLRPFDQHRSGTVLGEGCAVLVLESFKHALKRDAKIYGEILSVYNGVDLYHPLKMDESGNSVAKALQNLVEKAGMAKEKIDYINLHGTGTPWNDRVETRGLKIFFGREAKKISLSATKPFTGHVVGASGALELIVSLLAMKHQFIPPTLNLEKSDPECDLDYTAREGREKKIETFVCLAYGFGGHVGGILVRKV
ncbi:MAG: beta-ketoacyl-[acyl-carrier-protein] synthase family protein [Chlamydiae bacterium]|nr:beta-ketoacyl-[acyl-carrier-protein] synthase family protein [Chlamydiota bacterium]MBI3278178.1 beta-ketoacyl-[acyl-carrier-protein] synthase family protein [Chlamydiota bacterium]